MSDLLQNVEVALLAVWSDPLQTSAAVSLAVIFLWSLFGIGKKQGFTAQLAAIAPNTLTSVGIFFTFLGIYIALLNFDVSNINEAIPRLLDGLKLAFFSSVVGLGLSVLFRWFQAGSNRNLSAGEIGAGDLHDQLRELNENTLAVRDALVGDGDASLSTQFGKLRNDFRDFTEKELRDQLQNLNKNTLAVRDALIGEGDASLSTQFGKLRNDFRDFAEKELHDQLQNLNKNTLAVRDALIGEGDASLSTQFGKLRNDFRDFADKMKEDGTQALVKALEEVIKDFNEKISEQFGENFKQLNEAVGALLEWQKEHKEQVEMLTHAFREIQTGIQNVEQATAKIPDHMKSVETAFNNTEIRVEQLYEGLGSLSEMRESAKDAVPELQKSIESVTASMRESVDQQLEVLKSQVDDMRETQSATTKEIGSLTENLGQIVQTSLDQTQKAFNVQMDEFKGVLNSLNVGADTVMESTEKVATRVNEIIENFSATQDKVTREVQSRIEQSLADNVDVMNESFQDLDEGMQQQLQRALDMMGNNLTSITEQFVNTYEDNARRVVELTRKITESN